MKVLLLSSLTAAAADPCVLLKKSAGFCNSRPNIDNCIEWKKTRVYKCKAQELCDDAFKKSDKKCLKGRYRIADNWADIKVDSQAIGECFVRQQ